MKVISKKIPFGDQQIVIESGKIARQAHGSVVISSGGTSILVTVVAKRKPNPGQSFFPLGVHYQEKTYAAGKIPGGFFKREGRPSEKETLVSRLIDRPLRPLFPKGFMNEVQVIATLLSMDPEVQTDIIAMIGASAALSISGIPFDGPIGGARVGYIDNKYCLNPELSSMSDSLLNLVVAGTSEAILMVESEANELSEEIMLGAVLYGHEQMQPVVDAINELKTEIGKEPWEFKAIPTDPELSTQINSLSENKLNDAYQITDKAIRQERLEEIRIDTETKILDENPEKEFEISDISDELKSIEKNIVRKRILEGQPRIDGRDSQTVRDINIEIGLLERTHGSALFTR